MQRFSFFILFILWLTTISVSQANDYEYKTPSRDGIGKVYLGREISHVMGHLGAGWLERTGRVKEERTDLLINSIMLSDDDVIADLGAGTGFFSFPLARRVPKGKVLAVDIQPEMLDIIKNKAKQNHITNVIPVLATEKNPNLPPESIDAVLLVDAYHEFSHPKEVMLEVVRALKPEGKVYLIEYRAEDPSVMIKPLHKMTVTQASREMQAIGLSFVKNERILPQQHLMVFQKPPL